MSDKKKNDSIMKDCEKIMKIVKNSKMSDDVKKTILETVFDLIKQDISGEKNSKRSLQLTKHALMIGINYTNTSSELGGCINDFNNLTTFVNKYKYSNKLVFTDKTTPKPTVQTIDQSMVNILSGAIPGETVFWSYSGHGCQQFDYDSDEKTGYDQAIVGIDGNVLLDDRIKQIIDTYLKPGVTLIALFDCCFSGSILDLKYQYVDSLACDTNTVNYKENDTKGDVILISGCNDLQYSADAYISGQRQGAMTHSFLKAYHEGITWRQLLLTMRIILKKGGFSQIPQLSSGRPLDLDSIVKF